MGLCEPETGAAGGHAGCAVPIHRPTVLKSENAKLQADDRFRATQFLLGYPLFIDHIDRVGGPTPSYVAGKTGGLNRLEKL